MKKTTPLLTLLVAGVACFSCDDRGPSNAADAGTDGGVLTDPSSDAGTGAAFGRESADDSTDDELSSVGSSKKDGGELGDDEEGSSREPTATSDDAAEREATGDGSKQTGAGCKEGFDHDGDPNTACQRWTVCDAGEYVNVEGTPTTDRQCAPCAVGTYSDGQNAATCVAWSDCEPGSYVSSKPSASRESSWGHCIGRCRSTAATIPARPASRIARRADLVLVHTFLTNGGSEPGGLDPATQARLQATGWPTRWQVWSRF